MTTLLAAESSITPNDRYGRKPRVMSPMAVTLLRSNTEKHNQKRTVKPVASHKRKPHYI